MNNAIERFSRTEQRIRDLEGNIICPLNWQAVGFQMVATWNTGVPFRFGGSMHETMLAHLDDGRFVLSVPTAEINIGGLKCYQIRLHDNTEHWGVSQYLTIAKQSDVAHTGVSSLLYNLRQGQADEYHLVALKSLQFKVVSLTELFGGNFETKLQGDAKLNESGFFKGNVIAQRTEDEFCTRAPHIEFEGPLVLIFSQQGGFEQELEHILVGFAS